MSSLFVTEAFILSVQIQFLCTPDWNLIIFNKRE